MASAAVRSKAVFFVVVDLLINSPVVFWEFCVYLCFIMHYFVSILVLQSS